jgi:molybdopterin-containing oxidoreductase family iron-sulfur binding subunit
MGATGVLLAIKGHGLQRVLASSDLDAIASGEMTISADHQWVMIFDLRRCDGCRKCITGCQTEHFLPGTTEWIKVYDLSDAQGLGYSMPVLCMECENAPCVRVCPTRATYHRPDGVVVIDQDLCIGCRMCMAACPYGVRVFNWDDQPPVPADHAADRPEFTAPQHKGTVGKCQKCVHLLAMDQFPACLRSCSMDAIYIGDLVEDTMSNGKDTYPLSQYLRDNDAFRYRADLGTAPRVYYVAGHGQDLDY